MRRITLIVFLAALSAVGTGRSSAQSILHALQPQPRSAYLRTSAPCLLADMSWVLLDPAQPAWPAAERLNAGLRSHALDTLPVRVWTSADSAIRAVFLGIAAPFLNSLLARTPDQYVAVTSSYPGTEGYVLDVLTSRALVSGSDAQGLLYGLDTFLQLFHAGRLSSSIAACRVVDAPEFPRRWFLYQAHFDDPGDAGRAREIWDSALKLRLNGVAFADWWHLSRISSMPRAYADTLSTLASFAAARGLEIIPFVMTFGGSNTFLYNNPDLASGLPVKRQRFIVDDDTLRLLPRVSVAISNGGFERHEGDSFEGFNWTDQPGLVSFADTAVRHSGRASIRFESSTPYTWRWGMHVVLPVSPFTLYHTRAWVRTENFKPAELLWILVQDMKGKELAYNELGIPETSDWRRLDFTFNSLHADSITLWIGSWKATSGRVWWDDLSIEEVPFLNVLRRPGTPVSIMLERENRPLIEGVDVDSLRDPLRDRIYMPGVYSSWHTPPTLRLRAGNPAREGDTITVSYSHVHNIYGDYGQVTATMSDENTYDLLARETAFVDSIFRPRTYFMSHDEIRVMNWDDDDRVRGITPAAILAENVQRCMNILRALNPSADIWDWSDMFDPYHNAVDEYYLVNGSFAGCMDMLPRDLGIVNWNAQENAVPKSLAEFAGKGFRQMSAPYYDQDQHAIRRWKEWTRSVPGFCGMMYTTWRSQYTHLGHFSEYAWNHAPYIYHEPPRSLTSGFKLPLRVEVRGDTADSGWALVRTMLWYRLDPSHDFLSIDIDARPGRQDSIALQLPVGSQWVQWYITADDNRGWRTRIPFGDSVFYQIGSVPVDALPQRLSILDIFPLPARATAVVHWTAPDALKAVFTVTDILGRAVLTAHRAVLYHGMQSTSIDLTTLPAGAYVLTIVARGERVSRLFVRE